MVRGSSIGVGSSLAIHGAVMAALFIAKPPSLAPKPPELVEMDVRELPPPPPPEPPPPTPEPSPPPPPKRVAVVPPRPRPVEAPPPPPNSEPKEPPPDEPPPPPSFGVTLDSVVDGTSNVAVPVGNTVMTKERNPTPPDKPPAPLPATTESGPPAFSPVSEQYIGDYPRVEREVKADYPQEALRLGLPGTVVMRVGIDRTGGMRSVKVIKGSGHGFDEAAVKAMRQFRFTPCRTHQGEPVDCLITYTYTFQTPR